MPSAAANAPAPSRLCPQPCPASEAVSPVSRGIFSAVNAFCDSPDRASYSASIAITGLPSPKLAAKEVSMPDKPLSTLKPSASSVLQ